MKPEHLDFSNGQPAKALERQRLGLLRNWSVRERDC